MTTKQPSGSHFNVAGFAAIFITTCIATLILVPSMDIAIGQESSKVEETSVESPANAIDQAKSADQPRVGQAGDLLLKDFRPKNQLRRKLTPMKRAKFPVVDVHTHFHYKIRGNREALNDFVEVMDRNQIAVCVSLDGKLDGQFQTHRDFLWKHHKDRFVIYANIDWVGLGQKDNPATWDCHRPGFAKREAEKLADAAKKGVSGLKIFKRFGLQYQNPDGSLIEIDDDRWDPIWEVCGKLGLPVIIHTADPAAFFDPIDRFNERYEELTRHPDWSFHGDRFPSRDELLQARNRVIERHPGTTFIGAHIANHSEDLKTVSRWLDRYPNLFIEPASRISELGRQPYDAREFLLRYADRIMFGTDGPWPEQRLQIYWRFLETHDQSFDYSEKQPPPQGFWQIHAVHLPDNVLRKIYHQNAARLIPGVAERVDEWNRKKSNANE